MEGGVLRNSNLDVLNLKVISLAVQVVLEYERAVIFRLGRLLPGGAKGPGNHVHYHVCNAHGQNTLAKMHICGIFNKALLRVPDKSKDPCEQGPGIISCLKSDDSYQRLSYQCTIVSDQIV